MAINKIIISLSAVLSVCVSLPAGPYQAAPAPAPAQQQQYEPYEDRDYKFSYSVKDDPTYNQQTREENKYGNTITGQYTVLEPTGDLRVVNYVADDDGFRAEVQNQAGYGPGLPAPAAQQATPSYAPPPPPPLAYPQ